MSDRLLTISKVQTDPSERHAYVVSAVS